MNGDEKMIGSILSSVFIAIILLIGFAGNWKLTLAGIALAVIAGVIGGIAQYKDDIKKK